MHPSMAYFTATLQHSHLEKLKKVFHRKQLDNFHCYWAKNVWMTCLFLFMSVWHRPLFSRWGGFCLSTRSPVYMINNWLVTNIIHLPNTEVGHWLLKTNQIIKNISEIIHPIIFTGLFLAFVLMKTPPLLAKVSSDFHFNTAVHVGAVSLVL